MGSQIMVQTGVLGNPALSRPAQEPAADSKPISGAEAINCWIQYLMSGRHGGLEEMIQFLYGSHFFKPMHLRSELMVLGGILEERRPVRVLEFGTGKGGALFMLTHLAGRRSTVVSVDLPESKFGKSGYSPERQWCYERFRKRGQKLQLIRANSHLPWMPNRVKKSFGDQEIDFLLLDGDHRYAGVKEDFETYGPMVRKGGLIAFHDIVDGNPEVVGGMPKFWREIKSQSRFSEIIENPNQSGSGIGLLYVD